jgi:glycosyltransferase involved in cell wall biosynthesis
MPMVPGIESIRGAYDAVFAVGFPYTVFSFAALRTARACGAPLILTPFLHLATPGDAVNHHYTRPHQIRLLAQADLIISPTALEARTLASWGIPESRLLTLPMAIEHADVTGGSGERLRSLLGIPDGRRVVGQLGALDPNKGTTDLVRAVAVLNENRPGNDPVHLILAGAASPDFESFAAGLPSEANRWLSILPALPAADVPDFYDAIDVFAMPSRTDSFGIVFLEAWANAKPVVAAAAGGVVEVVEHGRTGLLVPFGNVVELADAIDRLLCDRELARRLGETGRTKVEANARWDDRVATLLDRLNDLLAARGQPEASEMADAG